MASFSRLLSRSQTATMRTVECFQMRGKSWPLEIRPVPIVPMLMRLLGDVAPNTEDGTIDGKPIAAVVAPTVVATVLTNVRREGLRSLIACSRSYGYGLRRRRERDAAGLRLRAQHQLRCEQAVPLRHRGFRSIDDVVDQLGAVGQVHGGAVGVARLLLIDKKQVIAVRPAADIDVLADLDEAVRAEDREAAVSPSPEAVGREPVDADVARSAVPAHQRVAEIFKARIRRIVHVADLRCHDVGSRRAREVQELIALMRADVAEDPA